MEEPRVRDRTSDDGTGASEGVVLPMMSIAYRWRRFLAINVLVAAVVSVIVSFVLPTWYKATASIISPKDQDLLNPLGAAGSVLRGLSLGRRVGGGALGAYNYLAILKSRSALDSIVRRFDLVTVYDVGDTSIEKAVKELRDNVSFELQDDDYITIEVYDRSPVRAAGIANAFVDVLNAMSLQLGTLEARNNREFIERRLEGSRGDLRRAEDALREYQERTRMIVLPDQASSSGVGGVAELYGVKAKKEIELAILRKSVVPNDPAIRQLELELTELDRKLREFPEIGIESIRLYREMIIQQKIVEILLPLYEQAKVDEQKDVPVLLVLDRAVAPERKAKPVRSLIVLASVFGVGMLSAMLAAAFERAARGPVPRSPFALTLRSWADRTASFYRVPGRPA